MTVCSQIEPCGRQAREVEGGEMVQCIDFLFSKLSNAIATKYLSCT